MLFCYTCINFSNVSCRMELEITVAVAFIISGFGLYFFCSFVFLATFVPGCEFWFCIAMLYACNRCYWALWRCFPIYCAFFPSLIADVVFLHRPIFQRENWPHNSPNLGLLATRLFSACIHLPLWTCFIWSWLNTLYITTNLSQQRSHELWSPLECLGTESN